MQTFWFKVKYKIFFIEGLFQAVISTTQNIINDQITELYTFKDNKF